MYDGEKLNSITHLVGAALALVGFGSLVTIGIQEHSTPLLVGFVVFGFTLVLSLHNVHVVSQLSSPEIKKDLPEARSRCDLLVNRRNLYALHAGVAS